MVEKHRSQIDTFLYDKLADIELLGSWFTFEQLSVEPFLESKLQEMQAKFSGVFVDLGVIDASGLQLAYAGPFKLTKANYEVKELNLMRGPIPDNATVVVIAAPEKPLFKEEINALENYLDHGGRLLVMLPPFKDGGLKDLLERYGFELKEDIVIDQVSRLFGGDYLIPMVNAYGRHEITERFSLASFFPLSRGVWKTEKTPDGVQVTMLASTSPESWAETDQESLGKGTAEFQEKKDQIGPVWIAAIAQIPPDFKAEREAGAAQEEKGAESGAQKGADTQVSSPEKAAEAQPAGENPKQGQEPQESKKAEQTPPTEREPGQLALVGSVDFASNAYLGMSGNYDFVLNTISFLAKDKEQIAIRPKTAEMDMLTLTGPQSALLFWISLVCMPVLILIAGLTAYRIRRKSR